MSSEPERIRGRRLQEIRRKHLRLHPLCVRCMARGTVRPATQVDHVVALTKGGKEEPSNRQSLCDDCHTDKTNEDNGYTVRPSVGVDGVPQGGGHHWES